ncbi:MAG: cyclic nucleotide-binding domain-containing protein [Desulfopila sp.]
MTRATTMNMMTEQPNLDTLLEKLLPFATIHSFPAGAMIMSPEDQQPAFYYVIKGGVEVSYISQSDTRITVAMIGEKEFFGEIGFFDGKSRMRDIQAVGPVEVAIFDAKTMGFLRREVPALYTDLIIFTTQAICHKFRRIANEGEPVASYAEQLSTKHTSYYAGSRPLPPSLLHSEGWRFTSGRVESFKALLFDLSHRLQKNEAEGVEDHEAEQQCFKLMAELSASLTDFQTAMTGSSNEEIMWGYVFKEIYPYLMRSKFVERAYYKPKGYAGDFLMMEHIYTNVAKGDGRLGEIVDKFCLQRPGSLAIRGRRKLMRDQLARISEENARQGKKTRIMNLACGPSRELFDFLADCPYTELIEALCIDIDPEALQYTNRHVNIFPHKASIRLMSENVIKWALGRVTHQLGKLDIIYSAGLCDYLDPRLFRALVKQCHNHLKPGGTVLLGNFQSYQDSLFLDKLLKWELIYRNGDDLRELFADTPFGTSIEVIAEESGVNLFALARKE